MRLLLHTCCAPCAIFPIDAAYADGYNSVSGFFYNPNIHTKKEYEKRKHHVVSVFTDKGQEVIEADYIQDEFFSAVYKVIDSNERCETCWMIRLERAALHASGGEYHAFTTTLLASPYQDHEKVRGICEGLGQKYNVPFYYKDFRKGFKTAHRQARQRGIYCQNYCGCVFSIFEREDRRKKRKVKQER